jgi:hypothetical protein
MKIRNFEYPQTLCSFEPFQKTHRYICRNLKNIFPENLIDILLPCHEYFEKPVTIKLQMVMYVTGNNSSTEREKLLQCMKNIKVIRPCRISTVARFMLSDRANLPAWIKNSDYIVVICEQYTLKISPMRNSVEIVNPSMIINPEIPVMMETDSI